MENVIYSLVILFAVLVSTTGASEVVYAQVGETVTIKPTIIIPSHKYLYWKFGKENGLQLAWRNYLGGTGVIKEEPWTNKLVVSDYSLIIKNVQPENFGTFRLETTVNGASVAIGSIKLVRVNVSVEPASPSLPGDSLSLACSVEARKKVEIHWLDPQRQPVSNSQERLTMRAMSKDSGVWTCVVANEKEFKVTVTLVDLAPAPSRPQYTSKSMPITIPCSFPAHISWEQIKDKGIEDVQWQFIPERSTKPQRLFTLALEDPLRWTPDQTRNLKPVHDPKTKNFTLARRQGSEDDSGSYVCSIKFKSDVTMRRTVQVQVLQIISLPGTNLISGQPLNLTCSTSHPLPSDLQLKWTPPKTSSVLPVESDRLTIPALSREDGGNWGCALWQGKVQLASATITLNIEPRLSVWMLVIICSAAAIVILLVVLIFIFYRRRNRKMRHLRHQLCRCKHPKPKGFYRT